MNVNWQDGRLRLPIQDESANGLLLSAVRGLAGRATLVGPGKEGWRTISPASANRYKNYTDSDRLTLGGTLNYNPFSWWQNRLTFGTLAPLLGFVQPIHCRDHQRAFVRFGQDAVDAGVATTHWLAEVWFERRDDERRGCRRTDDQQVLMR